MAEVKRQRVVVVRECLWHLVDKDFEAAAVLGQLIYWSLRTHDIDAYLSEEAKRMAQAGDRPNVEPTHGWVYKTAEDLANELLEICSRQTVGRRLDRLVGAGWLDKRNNPRHKWDRTLQYRPDLQAIDEGLRALGYSLEDALAQGDWAVLRDREQTSAHGEQTSAPGEQTSAPGEQAIPETTTEIISESMDAGDGQKMVARLVAFGISQPVAKELAGERDVDMITGWLDYARRARGLTNPPAFVVSKLRAGEPVPQGEAPQSAEEDRQRYLEWAQR